ncbi:MAG: agmatine deiminase family protein [Planctomycetes bacterium]|nr:agmatine deiminase family protein [Planctomycetota bacterium]
MVTRRLSAIVAFTLLAATLPAHANEFVSNRRADWYRFTGPGGQDARAQIQMESGNWRLWDDFAGFGPQWVYTMQGYDWFWFWDGRDAQPVANLSGAVGSTQTINIAQNRGTVRVAARNLSLTTPAGTFSDVTRLTLQTSVADAGTTQIWFARGVGIVKYETQSIAGPRSFELASASVNGQAYPAPTAPAPVANGPARAPSEHAPMEAVLFGCNDTYMVVDTYADAFRGLNGSGAIAEVVVTSNAVAAEVRYEMTRRNVPLDEVSFIVAALDSVWMRDYGPIVLKSPNGDRVVADTKYYPNRPRDDRFPQAYASHRGWQRVAVNLNFEGGNFATDGRGMAMSSNGVLWFNNMTTAAVRREFEKFGVNRVEFFEPLVNEGTTHIDMFARVMTDGDALVSRYPSNHRQFNVTEEAARKFAALGYRVSRAEAARSYDEFATYTNSVLANGVALVPQYGNATLDRAALDAYAALGYRAVGINSRTSIRYGGAVHCLSMQVPR